MVQGQVRPKTSQDIISVNSWVQWDTPVISAMWGSTNRRTAVHAGLGMK
jgi:hypothetical protein